jgi:circadian clock protein KaiC
MTSSLLEKGAEKMQLPKTLTGVSGFDDITFGGLPTGRPTLVCGSAGCGKTLFGMTFLIKGATEFNEPGVLMSFEEKGEDLAANVASLGYTVSDLIAQNKLMIDYVRVERSEIEENGEYDLEALFIRLDYAIKKIGAKRIVLDTIEALFTGLSDPALLRAELRRLFEWLRDKNVTAVITGERGAGQLTRHGLEEYISDCVILLDNRVHDQITTRRLRVVKYRGSAHGSNEYPFLIDEQGISVLPITSAGLQHQTFEEAVPSGIPSLDEMMSLGGYYRGSSVLLSGAAGTGKSIFSASFANGVCNRGERCLYFAFEESPDQIVRNMRSVGIDLQKHLDSGLLRIDSARPSLYGLEMHLTLMNREIQRFNPLAVVIDPISAFRGPESEVHAVLLRLVDILKSRGITAIFTNLLRGRAVEDEFGQGLSSLMDTWVYITNLESNGERNRGLYLLKSRGMNHSNQVREYLITNQGVKLRDVYVSSEGVLTGSARVTQAAREKAEALSRQQDLERREREFAIRRKSLEHQIAEMQATLQAEEAELRTIALQTEQRAEMLITDRNEMATSRGTKNGRN